MVNAFKKISTYRRVWLKAGELSCASFSHSASWMEVEIQVDGDTVNFYEEKDILALKKFIDGVVIDLGL